MQSNIFSTLEILSIRWGMCIAAWSLMSVTFSAQEARVDTDRPNVLLIITDQQHAEMMSCAGNENLETPAMDRIARDGIRFSNAYVTNPVCVPSRISMATGRMAGRFGVLQNGMKATIPPVVARASLGALLKAVGYDTFYGGKVHMSPELEPRAAGYDEYFRDQRDALPGACIEFMTRQRDGPFFAVASFINPHDICFAYRAYKGDSPNSQSSVEHLYQQALQLPQDELPPLPSNFRIPELEPDAISLYARPTAVTPAFTMRKIYDERQWRIYRWIYCRLTEQVDRHIGRLLDTLEQAGLDSNTLVVFTSDHGDMDACHRLASKGRFYEQAVRVPMLLQFKGLVQAGVVDSRLVSSGLDLLPTICDFARVTIPHKLPGRSLRPADVLRSNWRDYVVTENKTGRMLRSSRFKYCVYREGEIRESLVDLDADPGEMTNLIHNPDYAEQLAKHRGYLNEWVESTNDVDARSFLVQENSD